MIFHITIIIIREWVLMLHSATRFLPQYYSLRLAWSLLAVSSTFWGWGGFGCCITWTLTNSSVNNCPWQRNGGFKSLLDGRVRSQFCISGESGGFGRGDGRLCRWFWQAGSKTNKYGMACENKSKWYEDESEWQLNTFA